MSYSGHNVVNIYHSFTLYQYLTMAHTIIIGNGISGVTAARHIRKNSDEEITIISAETDYFFSRTALMYVFMGHMKFEHTQPYENDFWEKNRINLKRAYVESVDYDNKSLSLKDDGKLKYDKLILAVGSKPNKFGWPGQNLPGVQGLYSAQDLELLEENSKNAKHAVIVGGGLIGIELAEMLLTRGISVSFFVREKSFWSNVLPKGESALVTRHILEHHVDLRLETELKEIVAGEDGKVSKVITHNGEEIECQIVGLTAGVSPNIDFLKNSNLETDRGILVNEYLETNQPDVYAVGDCAQFRESINGRRPIEQVWYTGKMMGETVAKTICGNRTSYKPGHWFNSAKFFDIEYQTYGWVFPDLKENQSSFYWEHENDKLCVHFVFDKNTRQFIGVNTFGIRMRHNVFDGWLNENKSIEYIIEHLKDANFDPEFYKTFEQDIINKFNQQEGTSIQLNKKSWKRILSFVK